MLRELKDYEKTLPIIKFRDFPVVKADKRVAPLDPAKAIYPEDINIILDETKVPDVSGYCLLDNGASYISVKTSLPGVTKEMLQWMVAWQGLEPANYMVLNPKIHHSAAISDIDREKINLKFLSLEQKCQGIYVYQINKINDELEGTIVSYLSPADQGFDPDMYVNSGALTIGGAVLRQAHEEKDPQKKSINIMISVVREAEDGVDVHTHLWGGYKILRRESKRFDVNGIQPTEEYTEMLANYIADEWAQVGNILPKLYAEVQTAL